MSFDKTEPQDISHIPRGVSADCIPDLDSHERIRWKKQRLPGRSKTEHSALSSMSVPNFSTSFLQHLNDISEVEKQALYRVLGMSDINLE
mmetsp:Transcript_32543/g.56284  ORF Transcript_32543/g.56284 Transcript_32543/m.56284 type:complete len:90 (+) Transcript_32543:2258-2527(+)